MRVLSNIINNGSKPYECFLPALKECRRSQLGLKSILEHLMTELKAEESQNEIEMCSELLDKVFYESDTNQER